jgi:hypothetical protein
MQPKCTGTTKIDDRAVKPIRLALARESLQGTLHIFNMHFDDDKVDPVSTRKLGTKQK